MKTVFCGGLKHLSSRKRHIYQVERLLYRRSVSQSPRSKPDVRTKSFWEGGYYLLVFPATSMYLCYWQLQRKKWKEGLIKELTDKKHMTAVPLPDNLAELQDMEFTPVTVKGQFDYTQEVFLGPRSDAEDTKGPFYIEGNRVPGFHVITPFQLADKNMKILVNRGWYSVNQFCNEQYRKEGQVHGEIELVGYVRHNQEVNKMTKNFMGDYNKPSMNKNEEVYLVRNVGVLAERLTTSQVFLDAANGRLVRQAPKIVEDFKELRNTHMEYAITWFALAVITFGLWAKHYHSPSKISGVGSMMTKSSPGRQSPR